MRDRLRRFRDEGPGDQPLIVHHQLQLDRLLGDTLLDSMVRSTAWDTAQATGLVRNFDLQTTAHLTDVYALQRQGPVQTTDRIVALLFDRASHREENLPETLVLLEMIFSELLGQEHLLLAGYEVALSELVERPSESP
jgi:hypothetical protein